MGVIEEHAIIVKQQLTEQKLSKSLFDFIRTLEKELIELNKKQLNEDSKDIYGDAIGFYSKATEILTFGRKKAGEPYDMKDTGDFLQSLFINQSNNMLLFGSKDPKLGDILDNPNLLSTDLFGLTDKNLQDEIDKRFRPHIIDYSRKILLK